MRLHSRDSLLIDRTPRCRRWRKQGVPSHLLIITHCTSHPTPTPTPPASPAGTASRHSRLTTNLLPITPEPKNRPITHSPSIIPTLAPCNTYRRRLPAQSRHPADQARHTSTRLSTDVTNQPSAQAAHWLPRRLDLQEPGLSWLSKPAPLPGPGHCRPGSRPEHPRLRARC